MAKNANEGVFKMKNVCKSVVGIVGGMGSYATLYFFRKLLDAFPVEKEWERPHVIIDNNCVMPSRVRAILYGERREELVQLLAESIRGLLRYNVDIIVIACNTSHHFLPEIHKKVSIPDNVLVNLVETVTQHCLRSDISEIFVIATEGTIATKVYDEYCQPNEISVSYPDQQGQKVLRQFIEDVKHRQWDRSVERFASYLANLEYDNIVLGCTEFPVIFDAVKGRYSLRKNIIDPVQLAIDTIHGKITQRLSKPS